MTDTNKYLFDKIYPVLNDFQKDILKECFNKKFGGLSLPLGSGKTLISLLLSLHQCQEDGVILVVASKSLISNWMYEINKFFGDELKYEVIHQSVMKGNINKWKINEDTKLVLTTGDVLSKFYKENNVSNMFIKQEFRNVVGYTNVYLKPNKPFLTHNIGGGIFYSIKWGCLIVDEAQVYTNILTNKCQSIGSVCADNRWLLSGTLFDEPRAERILGYHVLLNAPNVYRNLPDTIRMLRSKFKGLNEHLVLRKENQAFEPPKVNEYIITHKLTEEETKIYMNMKKILIQVKDRARKAKLLKNEDELRKFTSYKMVMLMYLRQTLICPIIPISSIAIDASDLECKSELSHIVMEEIGKMEINQWLDDVNSVRSSRLNEVVKAVDKHKSEKIIIFSCFKSFLDILQYYLDGRPILRMKSSMSLKKRGDLIEEFKGTDNGVLLMTYELGACGLNLQFATTVLLTDFWWNAGKTQQAIGRIFRYGQMAKEINVYFFSADTGIENIIFNKQQIKLQILEELKVGVQRSKIRTLKIDDVIRIIEVEDNKAMLQKIKYY